MILRALPIGNIPDPRWEAWFEGEESGILALAYTESQAKL